MLKVNDATAGKIAVLVFLVLLLIFLIYRLFLFNESVGALLSPYT